MEVEIDPMKNQKGTTNIPLIDINSRLKVAMEE